MTAAASRIRICSGDIMASKTSGPTSTHNGHHAPVDAAWESPTAPAKPRKGKGKGKKKQAKPPFQLASSAPDKTALVPPSARRGVARVFQQTVGDPPTPWPIYLLRNGLLLLVDGIDARYGTGRSANDEVTRSSESRS